MKDTIKIKRENGKVLSITAEQGNEGSIIFTKTGDKSNDDFKRKIIFEPMDINTYLKFKEVDIDFSKTNGLLRIIKKIF